MKKFQEIIVKILSVKKNINLIGVIFLININAQTVSLENVSKNGYSNVTYAKDINGALNPFVGTWKGEYGSKNYELKLSKSIYDNGDKIEPLKKDILIGKLKVKNSNNVVLIDTFNETEANPFGLDFTKNLKYYMLYFSGNGDENCVNRGYLLIRILEADKMEIKHLEEGGNIITEECPKTFDTTFPRKIPFILTKQ